MDNIILSRRWVQGTPVTIDNLTGTAFTGEAQAHTFRISGVDAAGADVQITGTVTGAFLAPNNVTIPLEGTLTDGVAEVTLTSQCYELPGRFILSVYAANGDTNLCIYCGVGYVFCTETDQVAYPSAAIPDISQLIQEAQDVIDSIPEDYTALSAHFPATGKFVVGTNTSATEENAVAEGEDTIASGLSSHAEGYASEASGDYSHSEGGSIASGGCSHAEGSASEASGENAHAEGYETTASGDNSHSEGWGATASGMNAHAEGVDTVASGNMSHSEGEGTIANHAAQSVSGTYNVADPSQAAATAKGNYAEIVGNGTADNARSNARTLDWSGNEDLAGDLTINKNGANEMIVGQELSDLKSKISILEPVATSSDVGKALIVKTVENNKASEYEFGETGEGWTPAMKSALLQCFQHVVWDDEHGQEYYDDLYNALYPPTSISAVFDSTHTVTINDTLDSLKPYLTVTAHYGGLPDVNVTDYTLTGALNVGDNIITISFAGLTTTVTVTAVASVDTIDICLFAGQSNMDGRGDASEAPTVATGTAFRWDNSSHAVVDFSAEPSLIPAYVKTYYEETGVQICEVKKAIGGVDIQQYITDYLQTALTELSDCKSYLENHGKQVRRVFMLWNQGESDAANGTTTVNYESSFATLKSSAMASGIEQIFIVNIGQYASSTYDYTNIRTALQNVCNGTDVIMVSDKFLNATEYMDSSYHYDQVVYNAVGANAAENTVKFFGGETITIRHFDSSDVYGIPSEYGTLTDWTYELVNSKVLLKEYTGTSGIVRVYHQYIKDGYYYEARIARAASSSGLSTFTGNTTITNVSVDSGVLFMHPTGYSDDASDQVFTNLFKNCSGLSTFAWDNIPNITGMYNAFQNSGITAFNYFNKCTGMFNNAFQSTQIATVGNLAGVSNASGIFNKCKSLESVGNISGTYTSMANSFTDCSGLESIGAIGSTALTNISSMFNGCANLAGVVRFESSDISNASNAFLGCDLTMIEIQVPANSTTYTTITTAYPSANVTTF